MERPFQQGQDQGLSHRQPSAAQGVPSLIACAIDETLPAQQDPRMYLGTGMQESTTRTRSSHSVSRPEQESDVDEIDPPIAEEKMGELLPEQLETLHTPAFVHSQSIEDTSMIDSGYCSYCGVSLKTVEQDSLEARINEATEGRIMRETEILDSDMPTYEEHVRTPIHVQKKMDCNKYKDFKGREWDPLVKEIEDVISEVEQTKQPVTEAEKYKHELVDLYHNLDQLESQHNWGECSRLIEKSLAMFGGIPSQLKNKLQELQLQQQHQQEHSSSQEQQLFHPVDGTDGIQEDNDEDQEDDYEEFGFEAGDTGKQRSRKKKPRRRH